jgi:hypothetical protein
MALSGSYDFSLTARQVIDYALKKINVVGLGQSVAAADAEDARLALNMMLKSWQLKGPHLWKKTEGSVSLTNATQSYNLFSTLNPLRILDVRFRNTDDIDLPMMEMVRQQYFDLPQKDSAGIPTTYYFDPQRGAPTLYVWPVKATVTTETLRTTYQKRFDDLDDLDDDIDVEQEWLETVGYNLAARLADDHGIGGEIASRIIARAEMLHAEAMDYDREDTVVFTMEPC